MRQAAVLDVGCHSALLTVVRRRRRTQALETVHSRKVRLSLHQMLASDGRLRERGVRSVQRAVAKALDDDQDRTPAVFAFATSVIRDAPNRDEVITRVAGATGTRLRVLPGREEARLAYVAARHWAGASAGPLLVLDIGGGTLEVASGTGAQPQAVHSLPLGARTVTRDWLPGGVVSSQRELTRLRRYLRGVLAGLPALTGVRPGARVLACSKTFTQLAKLTSAHNDAQDAAGHLALTGLQESLSLLAGMDAAGRGELPGISRHRAEQSLAGALVAEALMEVFGAADVEICPWSTREGLLLERLGVTPSPEGARLVG